MDIAIIALIVILIISEVVRIELKNAIEVDHNENFKKKKKP